MDRFYADLFSFGNFIELATHLDLDPCMLEIKSLSEKFMPYNPRKKHICRWGLSLTEHENPTYVGRDLDSLLEYYRETGIQLKEGDFKKPSDSLKKLQSLKTPLKPFLPYLGRSHIIKLGPGGYFPFHRDAYFLGEGTFRLFVPLQGCNPQNFVFLLDGKALEFKMGHFYCLNTRLPHCVFSFEESYHIILNINLSEESTKLVIGQLSIR